MDKWLEGPFWGVQHEDHSSPSLPTRLHHNQATCSIYTKFLSYHSNEWIGGVTSEHKQLHSQGWVRCQHSLPLGCEFLEERSLTAYSSLSSALFWALHSNPMRHRAVDVQNKLLTNAADHEAATLFLAWQDGLIQGKGASSPFWVWRRLDPKDSWGHTAPMTWEAKDSSHCKDGGEGSKDVVKEVPRVRGYRKQGMSGSKKRTILAAGSIGVL